MAIEDSIRILDKTIETLNINHFRYTNPVLAQFIMKTYHSILKRAPELWDYLYDNPNIKEKTKRFRSLLHKLNSAKINRLIEWFKPDIIVCTQALPCVAMAEYKRIHKKGIPVVGVVTDYGVHSYWVDPDVDLYMVPIQEAKDKLISLGIKKDRIDITGIPISPRFCVPLDNNKLREKFGIDNRCPVVLMMGGSRGMISMDEIIKYLAKLPLEMHLLIVCGTNKLLHKRLEKSQPKLLETHHRSKIHIHLYKYINNVEEFMSVADIIVTKPGGLTTTEALSKGLPMVIINPIPGQEAMNTEFLIKNGAALLAKDAMDAARQIGNLITNQTILRKMKQNISNIAKPNAAFKIAEKVINWNN